MVDVMPLVVSVIPVEIEKQPVPAISIQVPYDNSLCLSAISLIRKSISHDLLVDVYDVRLYQIDHH